MAPVGVRIKRERNRRDLTQQQVAEATGVPVRTLRRIEKGQVDDSAAITVLCDYLQVPQDADALVTTRHDPPLSQATFVECLMRLYELHHQATGGVEERAPVRFSAEPPPVELTGDDEVIKIRPPGEEQEGGQSGATAHP